MKGNGRIYGSERFFKDPSILRKKQDLICLNLNFGSSLRSGKFVKKFLSFIISGHCTSAAGTMYLNISCQFVGSLMDEPVPIPGFSAESGGLDS